METEEHQVLGDEVTDGRSNEDDETVAILKNMLTSVMKDSNYFDECHQYDRMNDLDKVAHVLRQLIPVVSDMTSENKRCTLSSEGCDADNDMPKYAISRRHCDALVESIRHTRDMKPFGYICEG